MITIDGSVGGGQLLRTALSLSLITQQPFTLTNIRHARPDPGLRPQHRAAINACIALTDAHADGVTAESEWVRFVPGPVVRHSLSYNTGTAGSTTLLLQTLLPVLLTTERRCKLWLTGGTDTLYCPSSPYLQQIFLPHLARQGLRYQAQVTRHGFFPAGGGTLVCMIRPSSLQPVALTDRGSLQTGHITAIASHGLRKPRVADRLAHSCHHALEWPIDPSTEISYVPAESDGAVVYAQATYANYRIGATVVGKKGWKSEHVGRYCGEQLQTLLQQDGVDPWAADQLLLYLALHGGELRTTAVTPHIETNKQLIERFLNISIQQTGRDFRVTKPYVSP